MSKVIRAEALMGPDRELPGLLLGLEKPDKVIYDFPDHLLKTGVWHRYAEVSESWTVIYASIGDVYATRRIHFDPKGPLRVQGVDGEWRYSDFSWDTGYMSIDGDPLVRAEYCIGGMGNITSGFFKQSLVEAKIREAGLEFTLSNGRYIFSGRRDLWRDGNIYKNCKGETWGVHYYMRAHVSLRTVEKWGGAYWPDEATAKAAVASFIQDGKVEFCGSLRDVRRLFPRHPMLVVSALEEGVL